MNCPFCRLSSEQHLGGNDAAFFVEDRFPVSPGHALVIPRRHVEGYFDVTPQERAALWELVEEVRARQERLYQPDGYNVGINVGTSAGQTVMHLHIHLIPRYQGDVADPRGGIRHVIADKAKYW